MPVFDVLRSRRSFHDAVFRLVRGDRCGEPDAITGDVMNEWITSTKTIA